MICGSCGMRMDGAAVLACQTRMYDVAQAGHVPVISAMGNLPIVKDLVVDMAPFWEKFRSVNPFLQPGYDEPPGGREHLIKQERMNVVHKEALCINCAASVHAAVDAVLAAWNAPPLAPDEAAVPGDLPRIARQRGLEYLPVMGNASMLRVLDLPAVLELHVSGADEPRYAALTALGTGRPVLVVAGAPTEVDAAFLDRHWFGQAHVFWRDFEALGPQSLRPSARGAAVARLQALLRRAGANDVVENGAFDAATTAAVLDFQRARLLFADGRVGRLTRIVLYGAAGGYPRPTLVTGGGGTS